jgi:hypothetical protein
MPLLIYIKPRMIACSRMKMDSCREIHMKHLTACQLEALKKPLKARATLLATQIREERADPDNQH